ncbi:MAG: hypothetical protein AAGG80_07310, partial [Pseudomonadota bacterium]
FVLVIPEFFATRASSSGLTRGRAKNVRNPGQCQGWIVRKNSCFRNFSWIPAFAGMTSPIYATTPLEKRGEFCNDLRNKTDYAGWQ